MKEKNVSEGCAAVLKSGAHAIGLLSRLEGEAVDVDVYTENQTVFVIIRGNLPICAGDYGDILSAEAIAFIVEYTRPLCRFVSPSRAIALIRGEIHNQ